MSEGSLVTLLTAPSVDRLQIENVAIATEVEKSTDFCIYPPPGPTSLALAGLGYGVMREILLWASQKRTVRQMKATIRDDMDAAVIAAIMDNIRRITDLVVIVNADASLQSRL